MKSDKTNVVIITDIPTPYRIPLFNELNLMLSNQEIKLHVIFDAKYSERRQWVINTENIKYSHSYLSDKKNGKYKGLISVVRNIEPSVIISIGFGLASIKMLWHTAKNRVPLYIWTGSTIVRHNKMSLLNRLVRKFFFLQNHIGYIAYSTTTKDYLISQGVSLNRIHISLNTVDTEYFYNEVYRLRNGQEYTRANEWLYVGYLNKRKNVTRLLEIVHALSKNRQDFVLHIVGDGEERKDLEKYVEKNNLANIIKFYGYCQKEDIVAFYAKTGIFLFQTDFDIWGLVLNEAMASGLCCLSSVNAAATHDLIQHEVNGYAVDFQKKDEVIAILKELLDNPDKVLKLGVNASKFVREKASIEKSASVFADVIFSNIEKQ